MRNDLSDVVWVDLFRDRLDNPYEVATLLHERTLESIAFVKCEEYSHGADYSVFSDVYSGESISAS